MSMDREGYNFSTDQRYERKDGSDNRCEHCGKSSVRLTGHHIISVFIARRNPVLTKEVIRDIVNLQMLCYDCHLEADDAQKKWKGEDIGEVAWALFDLDQEKVAKAQGTIKIEKRKKKGKKGRGKRRATKSNNKRRKRKTANLKKKKKRKRK